MNSRLALVTIGTDGFVDYVQTPDGRRYNLGPVSVMKLVMGLTSLRNARTALKEFLENKQVMLSVDLDKMWALLPFKRARYSSFTNSLMEKADCYCQEPKTERTMLRAASYDTFTSNVTLAEDAIAKVAATDAIIDRLVSEGRRFDSGRAKSDLHKIASKVAEIAQNVDLASAWVTPDLADLSKKANEIHGLFEPAAKE